MDSYTAEQLERLVRLKNDGALSDAEFATAKARFLQTDSLKDANPDPLTGDHQASISVPDKKPVTGTWRRRFNFMAVHGLPSTASFHEAAWGLPFIEGSQMRFSLLAALLGPLYFWYLGIWKPGLSILGASIIYAYVLDAIGIPESLDRVAWVGPATVYGLTCIPLYYVKVRDGAHSWNPISWWQV